MSELQEVQRAYGVVLTDFESAYENNEISNEFMLGVRLLIIALMMKGSYRPASLKIVQEYTQWVGLDFDKLEEQINIRAYEELQLARMGDMYENE